MCFSLIRYILACYPGRAVFTTELEIISGANRNFFVVEACR
jgi:hypothetical protein